MAFALGKRQSTVSEWFQHGRIPDGAQYQIELATAGVLKADKPACRNCHDEAAHDERQPTHHELQDAA